MHGFGPDSAGEFLTRHPGVDAITFTGESATGSAIMRAAADGVKAVSFELGGKNAGLVFADADLDAAVAGSVRSSFTNGGQVCLCTERVYVQRPIFDEFADAARRRRPASWRTAGRTDEATVNMPLISQQHRDKVLGYYDLARAEGADGAHRRRRAARSATPATAGAYVQPTVLTGLAADAPDQPRGDLRPGAATSRRSTPRRRRSRWPTTATTAWRRRCGPATSAARTGPGRALDAGLVWVNTWFLRDLRTPFGGVKASGHRPRGRRALARLLLRTDQRLRGPVVTDERSEHELTSRPPTGSWPAPQTGTPCPPLRERLLPEGDVAAAYARAAGA